MNKISDVIKQEIDDAKNNRIKLRSGYYFDYFKTLEQIESYINNKYFERDEDDKTIFWNITNSRIIQFAKNIDLDTKDLLPYGRGETNFFQSWILKIKFQNWMKKNKLSLVLNDLSEGLATYGSVVWKRFEEDKKVKLEECDLKSLFFRADTKDIREANIVELHYLSEIDLEKKKDIWDNVEQVLTKIKGKKAEETEGEENVKTYPDAEIWERWGDYREEEDEDLKFMHHIGYGYGADEVILFEEEEDRENMPYYDFHIGKYNGRWLRIGVPERLFQLQIRANTLINQNAKITEWTSLLVLRTANMEMKGNVITQLEPGQIVGSEDLQQIAFQNPGLANFLNEMKMIEAEADKLCMTPEVVTGEALPSATPFRSVAVFAQSAKSSFRYLRERIGEEIANLLLNDILPKIVKTWDKKELIEICEDEKDIQIYDEMALKKMKLEHLKKANSINKIVEPEELQVIENKYKNEIGKVGRKLKIAEGFFDFEYGLRLNITGESENKEQKNDAINNAIQYVLTNPAVMNLPLFRQLLEDNGIQWWRLTPKEMQELQQGQLRTAQMPGVRTPDKLMALAGLEERPAASEAGLGQPE